MFPPVIKMLLIINVSVFILQHFFLPVFSFGGTNLYDLFIRYFALFSMKDMLSLELGNFLPWQIITYQFLHGGFFHLFFNMFALWMFGTELENMWGAKKFLTFYLLSGIGAAIVQLFVADPGTPTVGASGSVYGILLAFGLSFPNRPIFMFPFFIPIPAKYFVIIFAGIEMISGLMGSTGIAHFAHLGGAATGWLLLKYGEKWGIYRLVGNLFGKSDSGAGSSSGGYTEGSFRQRSRPNVFKVNWEKKQTPREENYHVTEESRPGRTFSVAGEEITQAKIDEILDKISESGYQNLSEKEKKILHELSKKL